MRQDILCKQISQACQQRPCCPVVNKSLFVQEAIAQFLFHIFRFYLNHYQF